MSVPETLRQTIGKALGRIPSGVFILTTESGGKAVAMMASWVQQASFQPPSISVAVAKDRPIAPMLSPGALFGLSVVGEHDSAIMKKYARGIPANADPFADVAIQRTPAGVPVLADALAFLECRVTYTFDFNADHDLYVATVTAGELLKDGASFTHLRGNGFHY